MNAQYAKALFMVRPHQFGFNPQTEASNAFQQAIAEDTEKIQAKALEEFDQAVRTLQEKGIQVMVREESATSRSTDAIFPNNWVSFHHDGRIVLYPMEAEVRRTEVMPDIGTYFFEQGYEVKEVLDYSDRAAQGHFLEGTGSMIFDYPNNKVYACASSRTDENLFRMIAAKLKMEPVYFEAKDENGIPIYHTNVMLHIGQDYAVICLDAMSYEEQERVTRSLENDGKEIIPISIYQMRSFCGNMLGVLNHRDKEYLLLSYTAFDALEVAQKALLSQFVRLLPVSVPTIEKVGGGSIRCMVAGVHLPLGK